MAAKPSNFGKKHPWGSVYKTSEYEYIASSIMKTKEALNNDSFYDEDGNVKETTYKEYVKYRKSMGYDVVDKKEFDEVNRWCESPTTASLFSNTWRIIAKAKAIQEKKEKKN